MSRRTIAAHVLVACSVVAIGTRSARAQDSFPRPHAFELSIGLGLETGRDLGARAGSLTANDPGGPDYALFRTDTSVGAARGVEARLAFGLTRVFSLEGAFSWHRRTIATHVAADMEGAPATTATLRATTWGAGGDLLAHVRRLSFADGRGVPFVLGGVRYLRQLDEHDLLVGTGSSVEAGGGVKYFFTRRKHGLISSLGARVDARVLSSSGTFVPDASTARHTTLGICTGLIAAF